MNSVTQLNAEVNMQTLPVIADIEIPVDAEGRYNLNAIHRASGLGDSRAPAKWARNQSAKELIQALTDSTGQICLVAYEGFQGGTFAHEILAVEYAGWISPIFRIKVNQAFIDFQRNKIELERAEVEQVAFQAYKRAARIAAADGWNLISGHIDMLYPSDLKRKNARISEARLINYIVLGMTASEFRGWFRTGESIRDHMRPAQTEAITEIEKVNYGLILAEVPWEKRCEALELLFINKYPHVRKYRNEVLATLRTRIEQDRRDLFPTHPLDSEILNSGSLALTMEEELKRLKNDQQD